MTRCGWLLIATWIAALFCTACEGDSKSEDSGPVGHLGAFSYTVEAPNPATPGISGTTCPATEAFGFGNPPPSPTTHGGVLDGFDGRGVFCVVAPKGNSFYVDVSAASDVNTSKAVSLQILSDAVDPIAGTTEASIVIVNPATEILVDADPCSIGQPRTLVPGEILADFVCPRVRPLMSDEVACAVRGTIEFRDCDVALEN